jgi:hypothetical protein
MSSFPLMLKINRDLETVDKIQDKEISDTNFDKINENVNNTNLINGSKEIIKIIKELSPKTIHKNLSNENFMKFQWSWTV